MSFYNNNQALIGFPVYLLVAIIVGSIVFGVFIFSILKMHQDAQVDLVQTELEKISAEAENMFEYADSGTLVTVEVDFPDSLSFVVFGDLPENGRSIPTDLTLDKDTSNCYFFVMDDGTIKTFSSNARFCGETTTEAALFYPGRYLLDVELIEEGGSSFVSISKK